MSLKFVEKNQIRNKPPYGQMVDWCRPDDKSLFELMKTKFTDAYTRHSALAK